MSMIERSRDTDIESKATKESLVLDAPLPEFVVAVKHERSGSLLQVLYTCLPAFAVFFGITVYSPLVDRLKADYHTTVVIYNINITLALVGLAISPLILNPWLEVRGGKFAVLASWMLFIVLNIGAAFVNNLGGLIVLRFFAFIFSGPVMNLFLASLTTMTRSRHQHLIYSITGTICLLGVSLGPVVGGLIEAHATGSMRNWSRYMIPILSFVAIIPFAIFGSIPTIESKITSAKSHYKAQVSKLLTFNMKEFIITGITLYLSQVYFFFFVTLGAVPYAFGQIRGYTPSEIALVFLALVIGVILSNLVPLLTGKQKAFIATSTDLPEKTMRDFLYCSLLIPIGLFLFGWTASMPKVHWAAPIVGLIIFAFGANVAFTYLNAYLANIYENDAQAALSCPLISQQLTASIAPLLTLFMIHNVTFGGSISVLAGVLTGMTAVPFLIYRYGSKLRNRSMYALK